MDDWETYAPPDRWFGDARFDEVRHAAERRCELEPFVDGARALLDALRVGSRFVFDDMDLRLLQDERSPWGNYVDPALSNTASSRRETHRIALYECADHVLEIRGKGKRWKLWHEGEPVETIPSLFEDAVDADEFDEFEPDFDQEEHEMTAAEREHLLGRAQHAEAEAKKARKAAEVATARVAELERSLALEKRHRSDAEADRARGQQQVDELKATVKRLEAELSSASRKSENSTGELRREIESLRREFEQTRTQLDSELTATSLELASVESKLADTELELVQTRTRREELVALLDEQNQQFDELRQLTESEREGRTSALEQIAQLRSESQGLVEALSNELTDKSRVLDEQVARMTELVETTVFATRRGRKAGGRSRSRVAEGGRSRAALGAGPGASPLDVAEAPAPKADRAGHRHADWPRSTVTPLGHDEPRDRTHDRFSVARRTPRGRITIV